MIKTEIPENLTHPELFEFLKTNKAVLTAQKKFEMKRADPTSMAGYYVNDKGDITKSPFNESEDVSAIARSLVINTTNWLDSHSDVHIPGLWKKSLSENKSLYLLQEHNMTFKDIISEGVQAFTKRMTWQSLGVNLMGETEALIFNASITKERNEFMFNQYRKGYVKNHSVGMRYVDIQMAINDESKYYIEEKAVWDKYINQIANKSEAEDKGYFWAVTQAKVVEGSAVPIGSNIHTPVLNEHKQDSTDKNQPPKSTGENQPRFDLLKAIKNTTFLKN